MSTAIRRDQNLHRTVGGVAEDIRDRNLSSLLGRLHRDGALSRAELTRRSGLNRSTVGAVIGDLVALGLVSEGPAVVTGAGRPSGVVVPDPSTVAVAINPEVDGLAVGLVGFGGRIVRRVRLPWAAPPSASETVRIAAAVVAGLTSEGGDPWRVLGAGIAVPGQVRLEDGLVRDATHLGWRDAPIAAELAEALGMPVFAANAAVLALRAEATFGVGRDVDDLFYIIGGASGIGGGAVLDGRLAFGADGHAGEVGHIFVADNGVRCHCGAAGCFETEVSRDGLLEVLGLSAEDAGLLGERLRESAEVPEVAAVLEHYRTIVRRVVRTVVNLGNPRAVVLGGFLAEVVDGVPPEELVDDVVRASRDRLTLLRGSSDPDLLLVGAAELVFAELIAAPQRVVAAAR
ncbi:ROK family transcriptional regulator [Agromyces seonyuensis]|uniref:ROK family protein n=1 Tax=Agromyces seonyuensis TaxID=2662446 RepID=A0A6I4P7P4_9MICO|nr:ROK family transcriptional regulator [Agromyces seonyuensis]MWB99837.1 ROK family protein [Agromyces seonyuensis]